MTSTLSRSVAVSSVLLLLVATTWGRTRPRYGGDLRIETSASEPPTFVNGFVADTLTTIDTSGTVQPSLATRWESQNNDRRWQFWIRKDVAFRALQEDEPSPLSTAAVADALTATGLQANIRATADSVILDFESPMPQLPALLASPSYEVVIRTANGAAGGTGRYRLASHSGSVWTFKAAPDYWGGRMYPETITVVCNRALRDQALDLSAHRADLIEVAPDQIRHAQQEHLRLSSTVATELIAISAQSPRLSNVHLRQALSEAIDRAALVNFLFQKQGEAAGDLLPNWMTGYQPLLPPAYDLQHARQLKSEVPTAPTLLLGYEANDAALQLVAERVALNARDLGIGIQAVPRSERVDLLLRKVHLQSPDPAAALTGVAHSFGKELTLRDASLDSVFKASRELMSDYSVIPVVYIPRIWATSDRLRDWSGATPFAPLPPQTWIEDRR